MSEFSRGTNLRSLISRAEDMLCLLPEEKKKLLFKLSFFCHVPLFAYETQEDLILSNSCPSSKEALWSLREASDSGHCPPAMPAGDKHHPWGYTASCGSMLGTSDRQLLVLLHCLAYLVVSRLILFCLMKKYIYNPKCHTLFFYFP